MKRKPFQILVFLMALFLSPQPVQLFGQEQQVLRGPILASRVNGGSWITFEDVGIERTWRIILPNSTLVPTLWSPDGCTLLFQGNGEWAILRIVDQIVQQLPLSPMIDPHSFGNMIWSFDGTSLTYTAYFDDNDIDIYSIDTNTFATSAIFSLSEPGEMIKWLSATELLYKTRQGDYFVWDTVASSSSLFQRRPQLPPTWLSDIYIYKESPNLEYTSRYYSISALRSFTSAVQEVPPSSDISPEYVATLEAMPHVPGFDIYSFGNNLIRHVDVVGQLLQFLVWSPSSERIAITTDPETAGENQNGIYVYNIQDERLEKLGNFPAMFNAEYGGYAPTWSADSNWLSFNTPTGYIIYNLETQQIVHLSQQFDESYMSLQWSPLMDYRYTTCQ